MFTRRGDPVEPQMFWDPPFTVNQLSLMFSHSMFTIFALNIDNIGAGGTVVTIPVTINYNMTSIYVFSLVINAAAAACCLVDTLIGVKASGLIRLAGLGPGALVETFSR